MRHAVARLIDYCMRKYSGDFMSYVINGVLLNGSYPPWSVVALVLVDWHQL